jgi:hypothetical protein
MLPAQIRILAGATAALFAGSDAQAGGFLIRGESTTGLGVAFAGVAAGNYLSSVFAKLRRNFRRRGIGGRGRRDANC